MKMKTYSPKDMYEVKCGSKTTIVKCSDQLKLEAMIQNNLIDEYRMLKVLRIE